MRNTPDVGTVVVGLARNDACLWRVCVLAEPWIGFAKLCEQCVVRTLSGVSAKCRHCSVEPVARMGSVWIA